MRRWKKLGVRSYELGVTNYQFLILNAQCPMPNLKSYDF